MKFEFQVNNEYFLQYDCVPMQNSWVFIWNSNWMFDPITNFFVLKETFIVCISTFAHITHFLFDIYWKERHTYFPFHRNPSLLGFGPNSFLPSLWDLNKWQSSWFPASLMSFSFWAQGLSKLKPQTGPDFPSPPLYPLSLSLTHSWLPPAPPRWFLFSLRATKCAVHRVLPHLLRLRVFYGRLWQSPHQISQFSLKVQVPLLTSRLARDVSLDVCLVP